MKDYQAQAEFLIARGYVTGTTVQALARKLEKVAQPKDKVTNTPENVFGDDVKIIEKIRDNTSHEQKSLIDDEEKDMLRRRNKYE
jgi:hypothetical protein